MYMRELHLGQGGMEVGSCEEKGHGGPRFIGARGVKSERERLGGGQCVYACGGVVGLMQKGDEATCCRNKFAWKGW